MKHVWEAMGSDSVAATWRCSRCGAKALVPRNDIDPSFIGPPTDRNVKKPFKDCDLNLVRGVLEA